MLMNMINMVINMHYDILKIMIKLKNNKLKKHINQILVIGMK